MHAVCRTAGNAGRVEALFDAVMTEGALVDVTIRVHDEACIIRTGGDTRLAPGAHVGVDEDDVRAGPVMARTGRAQRDAGCVRAVVAALRAEFGCQLRIRSLRRLDDPGSEVSRLLKTRNYKVLNPETGNEPNVYYLT